MTLIVRCDDTHRLVSYLYGESSPEERAAVESHLATCAACAAGYAGLQDVRVTLAGWQPPDVDLGFTISRSSTALAAPVPVPVRTRRFIALPAWAQAAAAVLVLSAGAAIANLEIRYGNDGVTIRTGWRQAADTAEPPAAVAPRSVVPVRTADDNGAWKTALADSEKRLRAEFAAQRTVTPQPLLTRTGAGTDDVLRQVKALIDESERRQQRELALRVAQMTTDVESQRRADLVRIEQNMGQIEGVTGAEAARQRELLNYLVRVSQRR